MTRIWQTDANDPTPTSLQNGLGQFKQQALDENGLLTRTEAKRRIAGEPGSKIAK